MFTCVTKIISLSTAPPPYFASQMQVQIVPRSDAFDGGVSGSLRLRSVHPVLLLQQLLQGVERGRGELDRQEKREGARVLAGANDYSTDIRNSVKQPLRVAMVGKK